MKLIKLGLISVLVLGIIITMIGLLFPSTVIVSRAVDIEAPKDSIFLRVSRLSAWSGWVNGMSDSTVTIISDQEAQLGNTHVQITGVTDSTVLSVWTNPDGQQQTSTIRLIRNGNEGYTVVQWQFVQSIAWYPWERFGSMMNDKIMGTMMEQNLQQLKQSFQ